jgi:hypothetical protein
MLHVVDECLVALRIAAPTGRCNVLLPSLSFILILLSMVLGDLDTHSLISPMLKSVARS